MGDFFLITLFSSLLEELVLPCFDDGVEGGEEPLFFLGHLFEVFVGACEAEESEDFVEAEVEDLGEDGV